MIMPSLKNVDGTTDWLITEVISKLFELVPLSQFKGQSTSDPLQFGCKRKSS